MELWLATTNAGKLRDFAAALTPGFSLAPLPGVGEMSAPEETADSFEGNAAIKAVAYSLGAPGRLVLADDSGLEVDALGGRPGVRSARWAEDVGFGSVSLTADERNNGLLVQMLKARLEAAQTARYRAALALALDGVVVATARGVVEGEVVIEPRGIGGFGYDPHFWIAQEGKTMAELDGEVRMRYSHRGRALFELLIGLRERLG